MHEILVLLCKFLTLGQQVCLKLEQPTLCVLEVTLSDDQECLVDLLFMLAGAQYLHEVGIKFGDFLLEFLTEKEVKLIKGLMVLFDKDELPHSLNERSHYI